MINKRIKTLLCGLGWWGFNWLKNIKENNNYELVGVIDEKQDLINKAKKEYDFLKDSGFTNIDEAIKNTNPDAVVVVVSPTRHGDIIKTALDNNINILSEKPLAKDLDEAKSFLKLYKTKKNIKFIVNQNYRGRKGVALIKSLIESDFIGDIGYFIINHQQTVKIPGYRLEMGSPILDDMSIHHFDLIRYLTNEDFYEIYSKEGSTKWSWFKGEPVFYSVIKMTNLISGIYCASWVAEGKIGNWNGNIQIFGSKGCIEYSDNDDVLFYKKHKVNESLTGDYIKGEKIVPPDIEFTELQYTLENFKKAFIDKTKCETDIDDNIKSFAAVLAARESIKNKKPILIDSLGLY